MCEFRGFLFHTSENIRLDTGFSMWAKILKNMNVLVVLSYKFFRFCQ